VIACRGALRASLCSMDRRPLSLSAVVAGLLVAGLVEVLLLMLGAAVGLTAFAAFEQTRPTTELGYGVYLIASLVVASFAGGLVASAAARSPFRGDGVLHGFVVWAALGIFGLVLVGKNADAILGGALRIARHTIAAEQPMATPAPSGDAAVDEVKQTVARASQGLAVTNAAEETRQNIAIGLWSYLGVELVLLLAALSGGALGTRGERRFRRRHPIIVERAAPPPDALPQGG
jgi:hypothetical protein